MKKIIRAKKSFKVTLIASVLAALEMLTALAVGSASTSEAYPVTPFRVTYGASVLSGEITWYYRSVHATGSVKAVSSGKTGVFQGESSYCLSAPETRTAWPGEPRGFAVDIPCDYPGGITIVYIDLYDVNGTYLAAPSAPGTVASLKISLT